MNYAPHNRRRFIGDNLKQATGLAIGVGWPGLWMQAIADEATRGSTNSDKILVVIQLSGGNDGLNTVVPFRDDEYRKSRPKLCLGKDDVIKLSDDMGLHPALEGLMPVIDSQSFSIVHGVGYPLPNRSHFESMDIWHTCQRKDNRASSGWLGRIMENGFDSQGDSAAYHLGAEPLPLALMGRGVQVPSIREVEQMKFKSKAIEERIPAMTYESKLGDESDDLLGFLSASTDSAVRASQRITGVLSRASDDSEFPESQLGEKLKVISRLILAGLKTKVYYVTLDGFDTHANQLAAHAGLLRQWADALGAFHQRLARGGESERVLVMTFSEFGRRLKENASEGTDHGAAAPMFLSGPKLPQLEAGELPSLSDLDDGDLKYHTDFRRVYAAVIEGWLGVSSEHALGGRFEPLPNLFAV
ncbi:DUF1501 domain-containing protein [Pirellulaceae bacterium SH449]